MDRLRHAGWLDAVGNNVIETPDLTYLDGWNTHFSDGWGIDTGDGGVRWTTTGYRSNREVADVVDAHGLVQDMAPIGDEDGLVLSGSSRSGIE